MNGKINKNSLKWVVKNSYTAYVRLALITLCSVALAICGVNLALASRGVIDTATGQAQGSLLEKSLELCAVVICQLILSAVGSNLNVRASGRLTISLRDKIFRGLLEKDWQAVSAYHSGELLNRINNDVNVIVTGVINILPSFLSLVTKLTAGFWVLFKLDATFSFIILIIGPVVLILARVYSKKMKYFHKKCQECDGKTASFMQESIQNILMIKSFGSEKYMVNRASQLQEVGYKTKIKRNTISIFAHIGLFIVFSAGYYIALAWGAYKLSKGLITFGTMTAFLQLINQVQTPFMGISSLLPQFYSMLASAERIMELEELENETGGEKQDCARLYDKTESIVIDKISFAYDKEKIFDNASFEIKKGEFAAIAGTSGVGKSTLMKLILGIISPESGEIYIKCKKGEKYKADKSVRGLFAYVPQGNMILSGTIRDNIKFAMHEAEEEKIIACAKAAEIWDFISEQPEGLDTVVGERGLGLSEGQVQRIAIARALLYDAPVLLLDEATSALDERTEARVLENIRKISGKTCIIISHKQAAIDMADEVIDVKNGKILNFAKKVL